MTKNALAHEEWDTGGARADGDSGVSDAGAGVCSRKKNRAARVSGRIALCWTWCPEMIRHAMQGPDSTARADAPDEGT